MTEPFTYGSVASGIEAATVAWHGLGWRAAWFAEVATFPSKVLAHHYPRVPNLGDLLNLHTQPLFNDTALDLLVGGTPCQSFSIAGLRLGLADPRGNLALGYCRLLERRRPRWFLWENVLGTLSARSGGRLDFATLLQAFRDVGYCCAWRVLDAQFFGVPQRRRRLFVVGHLGDDWRPPAAVLLEPGGGGWHPAAHGVGQQAVAGTLTTRSQTSGLRGIDAASANHLIPIVMATGQANAEVSFDRSCALTCAHEHPIVCVPEEPLYFEPRLARNGRGKLSRVAAALKAESGRDGRGDGAGYVMTDGLRRLTPLECERLQGFPDHYTALPATKDGPRYRALGNSMPVPVMRWLGHRLDQTDRIFHPQRYAQ